MNVELLNFLDASFEIQMESRNWRNSAGVSPFFQIPHIDIATHRNWLEKLTIQNPPCVAFFITVKSDIIGVTYIHSINYTSKSCDFGIYIHNKQYKGLGLGKQALSKCLEYAKSKIRMEIVFLEVLSSNTGAVSMYENFGFKKIQSNGNILRYSKKL